MYGSLRVSRMMHTLYGFGAPQWAQSSSGIVDMFAFLRDGVLRLWGALDCYETVELDVVGRED